MRRVTNVVLLCGLVCLPAGANTAGGVGALPLTDGSVVERRPTQVALPQRSISNILSLESDSTTLSGGYGKPRGIFGSLPLTIGPKVSALGLPSPFRAGIEAKWDNSYGIGFDVGAFPVTSMQDTKVKIASYVGTARYYPWRGPFYLGLGVGTQNLTGSRTQAFSGADYTVTLGMDSVVVVPQVGWRWVYQSGFFLGVEAGLQVAVSSQQSVTSDAPSIVKELATYQDMESFARKQADVLGKIPLPHFAVLQVGYFF